MKFLMLPSKDSRTGKEHNLDKFGVWHPKCKPELCFPYKNVPKFFQAAISGHEGDVILKHVSHQTQSLSAKLLGAHGPVEHPTCSCETAPHEYAADSLQHLLIAAAAESSLLWMLTSA